MNNEFSPCETCPINLYRESLDSSESEPQVSDETLEKTVKLAGSLRLNAFQAAALSYMELRHEAPEAPGDEIQAALRSVTSIIYPGGNGCEKWQFDDKEETIVPRLPVEQE